jgi:hypothetical protein
LPELLESSSPPHATSSHPANTTQIAYVNVADGLRFTGQTLRSPDLDHEDGHEGEHH